MNPPARKAARYGDPLSDREIEVIRHTAEGLGNDGIARHLWLSVDSVKTHLRRSFAKLGAYDRSHLIMLAFKHGYLWFDQFGQLRQAPAAQAERTVA